MNFDCQLCRFSAYDNGSLLRHLWIIHEQELSLPGQGYDWDHINNGKLRCDNCGKLLKNVPILFGEAWLCGNCFNAECDQRDEKLKMEMPNQ